MPHGSGGWRRTATSRCGLRACVCVGMFLWCVYVCEIDRERECVCCVCACVSAAEVSAHQLTSHLPSPQVQAVYPDNSWRFIAEHVADISSKQCVEFGDLKGALRHARALLEGSGHRPAAAQAHYMAQFVEAVKRLQQQQVGGCVCHGWCVHESPRLVAPCRQCCCTPRPILFRSCSTGLTKRAASNYRVVPVPHTPRLAPYCAGHGGGPAGRPAGAAGRH